MANTRSAKKVAKKPGRRKVKKKSNRRIPVKGIAIFFSLMLLLVFTVGAVAYVIFFRTVIADSTHDGTRSTGQVLVCTHRVQVDKTVLSHQQARSTYSIAYT